ncbi:MAG: trigger factor [Lachnospiraceae bacterium]|jgi:trigger factor|nr:trigger factor [Lachnospiraceae bacterium]
MNKNKINLVAVLVGVILAVAAVVAGCSKKEAAQETTAATQATEGTADATTGADAGNEGVTAEPAAAAAETEAAEDLVVDTNAILHAAEDKISLADYKTIRITMEPVEITDEEVQYQIDSVLSSYQTTFDVTDRPAELGDTLNIDFKGLKDGVAFEGGTSEGYDLELGSGAFIPGFEDGLVGAAVGEQRNLDLTFPEDYGNTDLAGAAVVFEVTVNSIKRVAVPELTDDFVQGISQTAKTVAEYEAEVKTQLYDETYKQQRLQAAFLKVLNESSYELTDASVDAIYDQQLASLTSNLSYYGYTLDDYYGMMGYTQEQFEDTLRKESRGVLKQQLMVKAVSEQEGLTVSTEEKEELAATYGYDDLATMLSYGVVESDIDDYLLSQKVWELLGTYIVEG